MFEDFTKILNLKNKVIDETLGMMDFVDAIAFPRKLI
jgi:hypothetical protein